MPCRCAASAFSRMPPTGSTRPLSVISPVIATSSSHRLVPAAPTRSPWPSSRRPTDRPSGIAPAGTWTCRSWLSRKSGATPSSAADATDVADGRARRLLHHVAELAGEDQVVVPGRQQARLDEQHVAARSRSTRRRSRRRGATRGTPTSSWKRGGPEVVGQVRRRRTIVRLRARPLGTAATRAAILRATAPIWRSRLRTPASRVYSGDDAPDRVVLDRHRAPASRPCSSSCRGTRYRRAMWSFSSSL